MQLFIINTDNLKNYNQILLHKEALDKELQKKNEAEKKAALNKKNRGYGMGR